MPLPADPVPLVDLSQPSERGAWRFFTDQVMGGVSTGTVQIVNGALVLSGSVSTRNNGGFIQARRDDIALPPETEAMRLRVRGDGQTYYLHIRTRATMLPWQYYQAPFVAPEDWSEIDIPLAAFRPSGVLLPRRVRARDVRSVALVAYGRDHEARVSLSALWAITE